MPPPAAKPQPNLQPRPREPFRPRQPVRARRPDPATRRQRPLAVTLIAFFEFAKGGVLIVAAAMTMFAPQYLPYSDAFSEVLYIAEHGKPVTGILIPLFGLYICWIGVGILHLRPRTRRNLALSSAITIALSLQRLGLFGESSVDTAQERQWLYMLILLDLVVYLYLAYHSEVTRAFRRED